MDEYKPITGITAKARRHRVIRRIVWYLAAFLAALLLAAAANAGGTDAGNTLPAYEAGSELIRGGDLS